MMKIKMKIKMKKIKMEKIRNNDINKRLLKLIFIYPHYSIEEINIKILKFKLHHLNLKNNIEFYLFKF